MLAPVSDARARFSLDLPQRGDAALVARFARRAEDLGFGAFWAMDNVLPRERQLAPSQLQAFAAAHTTRARLGIAVFVMPHYNPAQLARELATLDVLCDGRLDVGVGLGSPIPGMEGLGFPEDRPLRRLAEGVEVMRSLWTQPRGSFVGEIWSFEERELEPKPVQQPHPPIWFGVGGPRGLRLAARSGDGWIGAGSSSSEQFIERAALLREELAAAGRDPAAYPIAKRVYLSIGANADQARAALAPVLDGMYRTPGLTERVAVCGAMDECVDACRVLLDAGAGQLVFNTPHDPDGQLDAVVELVDRLS
jgi:alkanesulfonate monooxygenase SsuD/methylene tetrahydromethanopterin reductase-like flavin-dependent oxidoreductase (luciferase family)